MKRGLRRLLLWAVLAPCLLVLTIRAFVGDVYYVDSRSMEPVLHGEEVGGEHVFVRFDDDPSPQRFDLVVVARRGVDEPVVKRVAGLGGETLQIAGGDLYLDGKLLPPAARRPPRVLLFDSRLHEFSADFHFDDAARWRRTPAGWQLDARGAEQVVASWRTRLTDDYLAPDATRVPGQHNVNDAALELELRLEGPWKRMSFVLTEEDDLFLLELVRAGETRALARLARTTPDRRIEETLAELEVELAPAVWRRIGFHNLDNEVAFELDGELVLQHVYAHNTAPKARGEGGYTHALPRIELGGDDLVADLRRVRVWRDVYYTDLGRFAIAQPETLAPDEIFVLGDNSGESVDSREWGPVPLREVIGRPLLAVWPPSRWRGVR